jgi:general secretion pathway protein G
MRGYTLIELLIVVLLLGLVSGLALPRLSRMYDSGQMAFEKDDVLRQIASLGHKAFTESRTITIPSFTADQATQVPLALPDGWALSAARPIVYLPNGVCSGGTLTVQYKDRAFELLLEPPLCRPQQR